MVICAVLAIALPLATSVGIVVLLAWLILFAAVAHLMFAFHSHGVGGFLWKLLLAVLYGFTGVYLLMNPVVGVASLTLLLAFFLLVEGILEIVLYFNIRRGTSAFVPLRFLRLHWFDHDRQSELTRNRQAHPQAILESWDAS